MTFDCAYCGQPIDGRPYFAEEHLLLDGTQVRDAAAYCNDLCFREDCHFTKKPLPVKGRWFMARRIADGKTMFVTEKDGTHIWFFDGKDEYGVMAKGISRFAFKMIGKAPSHIDLSNRLFLIRQ